MAKGQDDGMSTVRNTAVQIVYNILEKGSYANLELDKVMRKSSLPSNDKKMLTEIVNGTIRMLKHLDWVLNFFLNTDINKQNPWLKNILRVSLYQILFMNRVPDYAAVNEAVEMTRRKTNRNLTRVTNGVLRNIIRNKDNIEYPQEDRISYLSVYYSHPEWLVKYLIECFGNEESEKILHYNNQPGELVLRTNLLKISRDDLLGKLKDEHVEGEASKLTPWGITIERLGKAIAETEAYKKGYFYVQNEASMLAAAILNPGEGNLIYDLCCGLGGKTTHLGEFVKNNGNIKAFDIHDKKIELLKQNCDRLGINIVDGHRKDVLDIGSAVIKADRVLLDVPCSGLGVLNRRVDSRWHKTKDDIIKLQNRQAGLIHKAAEMLKKDGLLLYSTCTIDREENEEIVRHFLDNNREFILQGFAGQISFFPLDERDREYASRGMLTIIPGKYGTDGMFYALMRRKNIN